MEILETNGNCPYCRKKFFSYNAGQRLYGSPIQRCKHCGADYLDRRFSEVAVSGIPAIELSVKKGLRGAVLGVVIFLVDFIMYMVDTRFFGYYYTTNVVLMVVSPLLVIVSIVDIIRVKTGSKAKEFERYMAESESRLSDPAYAAFLKEAGYDVPEDFLKESKV